MPSLCHESIHDDDSGSSLSLGRKPVKKRQRDSLNVKMGQMLQRAALTVIPYAEAASTKRRRREQSARSSSSTQHYDVPSTPVEEVLNSARGKSVGEGFSVIKNGSSPSMHRSGFLRSDVPSWRADDGQETHPLPPEKVS